MKELIAYLGMLLGMLMCVAGLVAVVFTQFDPVYGGLGLLGAVLGGGLTWWIKSKLPNEERSTAPHRSEQAPLPSTPKHSQRGKGRM